MSEALPHRTAADGVGTPREQIVPLARAFLARFFDNEITGGTDDLKESFFWLTAFLAAPGVFASVWMSWTWGFVANFRGGVEVLRTSSSADKVLYLGFGMVATGVVTSIVWQSLLVDRRDALVLGSLPVGHRVIVQAKLLAVLAYVALIVFAMHALASIGFGVFLGVRSDASFAARGIAAHFIASSLGSLFVFLCAIAAQGSVLALLGMRGFARLSALLQLAFVALVVLGLLALPTMSVSAPDTVWGTGPRVAPWILLTPPFWFLGVYETILGTQNPVLLRLAQLAWTSLGVAAALSAVTYLLAYRRVMRDTVEHPDGLGRMRLALLARFLPVTLARGGQTRAAMQFFLATIGRVERHRFALALAGGAAVASVMPALLRWHAITTAWSAQDQRLVLSLPIGIMTCMLVGLRIAASLPSDLRARWVFQAADPPRHAVRAGVRRVMVVLVVLPSAAIAGASGVALWDVAIALRHGALTAAAGWLIAEYLVGDVDGVPCAAPWRPEHANLRMWWPAYLVASIVVCGAGGYSLSALELASFQSPTWNTVLVVAVILCAACVRWRAGRRVVMPAEESETFNTVGVLDLN